MKKKVLALILEVFLRADGGFLEGINRVLMYDFRHLSPIFRYPMNLISLRRNQIICPYFGKVDGLFLAWGRGAQPSIYVKLYSSVSYCRYHF